MCPVYLGVWKLRQEVIAVHVLLVRVIMFCIILISNPLTVHWDLKADAVHHQRTVERSCTAT